MVQQSLGENFELLVIDADSPEGEYDVIKEYQSVWPNIRYERINYRIGIYDAWNVAVGLARGEYLTNTNLDDLRRRDFPGTAGRDPRCGTLRRRGLSGLLLFARS